jgi:outer membrane protein TolC
MLQVLASARTVGWRTWIAVVTVLLGTAFGSEVARAQEQIIRILPPDEKTIKVRDPQSIPHVNIPPIPDPATVTNPHWDEPVQTLGLDEAIRVTLSNSDVIRILAGITAVSSGSTIYDTAIIDTGIDQAKARFDPNVSVQNTFTRTSTPIAQFDLLDPRRAFISPFPTTAYDMNLGVTKVNSFGGTATMGVNVNPMFTRGLVEPLNPQTPSSISLGYTQPLLQGGGLRANLAPIIIARLNTERSFFQFKDNMQQSVRSVVQAYWQLVFARTDVWARRKQVEQGEEALRRAEARLNARLTDISEVSQARTSLATFKTTLISSEANQLNQEAALANLMGVPLVNHLLPLSPPEPNLVKIDWPEVLRLAQVYRPDLIELELILEADRQALYQARNQARPRLDATMQYTWNGLEGTMPNGAELSTFGGSFTNWSLGVNFSVPLGLRQGRAVLRQQELILFRDQANLEQGVHNATYALALRVRNIAQFYDEYVAFREGRIAARINLERQMANYARGRTIYLNVLQAITDWGNFVSSESQALTQYNTELANLETETGTILETHGIRFSEERYRSLGPLGGLGKKKPYPEALPPGPNQDQYPTSTKPAEEFFDLRDPIIKPQAEQLPAPRKP